METIDVQKLRKGEKCQVNFGLSGKLAMLSEIIDITEEGYTVSILIDTPVGKDEDRIVITLPENLIEKA